MFCHRKNLILEALPETVASSARKNTYRDELSIYRVIPELRLAFRAICGAGMIYTAVIGQALKS